MNIYIQIYCVAKGVLILNATARAGVTLQWARVHKCKLNCEYIDFSCLYASHDGPVNIQVLSVAGRPFTLIRQPASVLPAGGHDLT